MKKTLKYSFITISIILFTVLCFLLFNPFLWLMKSSKLDSFEFNNSQLTHITDLEKKYNCDVIHIEREKLIREPGYVCSIGLNAFTNTITDYVESLKIAIYIKDSVLNKDINLKRLQIIWMRDTTNVMIDTDTAYMYKYDHTKDTLLLY